MNKTELINWLQEEYQQWEALLERVGPIRMDQPGVSGSWSMKDIVAHLTAWNIRLIATLQAAQRNEPEPPPQWPAHLQTEDEVNAWIYETNLRRPLNQVLEESQLVFQQLFAIVDEFPEDVRIETVPQGKHEFYLAWLGDQRVEPGEFFDHLHDDHEADIRAWVAQIEKQ
jgi:hypothetical protein